MKKQKLPRLRLSREEREIEQALVSGALQPLKNQEEARAALMSSARFSRNNSQHISLRVPAWTLADFKAQAMRDGIPYQTAINMLMHNYANGKAKPLVR
jgi:predicted DNA binding CopG/RHH family protein